MPEESNTSAAHALIAKFLAIPDSEILASDDAMLCRKHLNDVFDQSGFRPNVTVFRLALKGSNSDLFIVYKLSASEDFTARGSPFNKET
jgi:hypothetical protein